MCMKPYVVRVNENEVDLYVSLDYISTARMSAAMFADKIQKATNKFVKGYSTEEHYFNNGKHLDKDTMIRVQFYDTYAINCIDIDKIFNAFNKIILREFKKI